MVYNDDTILSLSCLFMSHSYNNDRPPLLLISIDGYAWDYIQRGHSPVLERLARLGVTSEYLLSVFPTMTFPNHYSIVTVRCLCLINIYIDVTV